MRAMVRTRSARQERTFIGRRTDLDRIEQLLDDGAPLVTLTGTAGIGKSALARRILDRRDGLCAFCELTTVRGEAGIRQAVADALGLTQVDGPDGLVDALSALGPALLVLDNFEHLVAFADGTVSVWLAKVPELQLLVTSRERLRASDELVHELAPLPLPTEHDALERSEAAQLWLARVREQRPDYAFGGSDDPLVKRLLTELDGLPLAIELAAARMDTLQPAELVTRLEGALDVLAARRGRGAITLRAALEWSWELLSADERDLLARCAVFRGRIAPDAVESIAGSAHALETLQALRDKSLLHWSRDGERTGLAMLVSIRKLAEEKLTESGQSDEATARHASYFLAFAEHCAERAPSELSLSMQRLLDERENLLASVQRALDGKASGNLQLALRILVAIDEVHWSQDGSPVVYLSWFDRALEHPGAAHVEPKLRARALLARARMAWRVSRIDTTERDIAQAMELADASGDRALSSLTRRFLALTHLLRGQLDDAEREASTALTLASELDDARLRGMARSMRVVAARLRGDSVAARREVELAIDDFRQVDDLPFLLSMRLENMFVDLDAGELEAAALHANEAAALHERLGIPRSARLLFGLGHAALDSNDPITAEQRYAEARDAARAAGEIAWEISASTCKAIAMFEQGRMVEARFEYRELLPRIRHVGKHVYSALFNAVGAIFEASLGHHAAAAELLTGVDESTLSPAHRAGLAICHMFVQAMADHATDLPERVTALRILANDPKAPWVAEGRLLARLLERALTTRAQTTPPPARSMVVAEDGRWFAPPAGSRVECGNRPVMRRLLLALAHARLAESPRRLNATELIAAGWPGERIRPESAKNRLHVMLTRIRALGLREVIDGDDRGYFFSAEVSLAPASPAES